MSPAETAFRSVGAEHAPEEFGISVKRRKQHISRSHLPLEDGSFSEEVVFSSAGNDGRVEREESDSIKAEFSFIKCPSPTS
jgi:hypothetical protein